MKRLDRILQDIRIGKAGAFIREGDHVLDIGCAGGELLKKYEVRIGKGVGIDPDAVEVKTKKFVLLKGYFAGVLKHREGFNCITMLAVLEHVPMELQPALARDCFQYLLPGGRLIITVPSPLVDTLLRALKFLKLVDGMKEDQHYGYDVRNTVPTFGAAGFRLITHERFEGGLNHLFVFEKAG
jgi:2-polyprenyl-3-methyl-5-hydroxy-6-metoxy-1,4-benzoquinol methylase